MLTLIPRSSASHRGRPITQRVLKDLHRACWSGSVVAQVTWPHRRETQPNPLNIHELIAQRPYHICKRFTGSEYIINQTCLLISNIIVRLQYSILLLWLQWHSRWYSQTLWKYYILNSRCFDRSYIQERVKTTSTVYDCTKYLIYEKVIIE